MKSKYRIKHVSELVFENVYGQRYMRKQEDRVACKIYFGASQSPEFQVSQAYSNDMIDEDSCPHHC